MEAARGGGVELTNLAYTRTGRRRRSRAHAGPLWHNARVDRRLASRNIRTGLIAGAVSLFMFGASFLAALIY